MSLSKELLHLLFICSFFGGLVGMIQTVKNPGSDFSITLKTVICMLMLSVSSVIKVNL